MTQDRGLERRRLAYRRAGYAVARHAQGRRLGAIGLEGPGPEQASTGRRWPVDLGAGARHDLEMEILAQWAGLTAESRACFEGREPEGGWGAAREPLAEMGRRVTRSEEENDAYLEWLRRRALGLLDLPGEWEAIAAVAESLLEAGRLREQQVTALIIARRPPRKAPPGLRGLFRDVR